MCSGLALPVPIAASAASAVAASASAPTLIVVVIDLLHDALDVRQTHLGCNSCFDLIEFGLSYLSLCIQQGGEIHLARFVACQSRPERQLRLG